jgi:hypothetical protein
VSTLKEIYESMGKKLPFKVTDGVSKVNVEALLSNGHFAVVYEFSGDSMIIRDTGCFWTLYNERSEIERLERKCAGLLEALKFYADKDGEAWAACRPEDTADTCCHMIAEDSGGERARAAIAAFEEDV